MLLCDAEALTALGFDPLPDPACTRNVSIMPLPLMAMVPRETSVLSSFLSQLRSWRVAALTCAGRRPRHTCVKAEAGECGPGRGAPAGEHHLRTATSQLSSHFPRVDLPKRCFEIERRPAQVNYGVQGCNWRTTRRLRPVKHTSHRILREHLRGQAGGRHRFPDPPPEWIAGVT